MRFRVLILTGLTGVTGVTGVTGLTGVTGVASLAGGCGGGEGFASDAAIDAAVPGTVTLAWSLADPSGNPITCAQVGASTVALQLQGRRTAGVPVSLSCDHSPATSQLLAPDTYDVSIELHGAGLTSVVVPDQNNVVVRPGANTQLGPVVFKVDPTGALVASLHAGPQITSNCGGPPSGAGIATTTIALQHDANGPCEPITFTHTKGTTTLEPYTVNCSAPQVVGCIENDESLSVASLPSGPYTIHIVGKINAAACWKNDDSLQIPAQGKTQTTVFNLSYHPEIPGCPARAR